MLRVRSTFTLKSPGSTRKELHHYRQLFCGSSELSIGPGANAPTPFSKVAWAQRKVLPAGANRQLMMAYDSDICEALGDPSGGRKEWTEGSQTPRSCLKQFSDWIFPGSPS